MPTRRANEHLEPELNRLMQEDEERGEGEADFDDRVKAAKRKAIEDNIARRRRPEQRRRPSTSRAIWWCEHDKLREREVADENDKQGLKEVKEKVELKKIAEEPEGGGEERGGE
jgi:hypothetical protein